jgi:hypothetical protein
MMVVYVFPVHGIIPLEACVMFVARQIALLCLFSLGLCGVAIAAEEASTDKSPAGAPSAERIDELVEQLNADRYTQREAAMKELIAVGKPAIEALGKAAISGSLEVTSRSVDILKKLYESSDEATKAAAEQALKKLAEGDHPAAARRAKAVLKPKDEPRQGVPGVGPIVIGQGQFRMQAGNKNVSVRTVNGVKTIEVQEGDKKTKIVDDPKQGIEAEITTKKDGKEKTEKIKAKNAEELKKKNKEVHDLYEQYAKKVGMGQIQIQIGNLRAQAVPGRAIRPVQPQRVKVDMATRLLKIWTQQLARMTSEKDLKGAPKESIDELQKQIDEVKRQIAELEKRIQARDANEEGKAEEDEAEEDQPEEDEPEEDEREPGQPEAESS